MVKYVYVLQFVHQKTTNQIERQNVVTWGIIKTALTRYDVKITPVIYPKYSKNWPYTVAHTIDCVCSKMLNHGLNHGLFLSLFKLIPCPIHWVVYSEVSIIRP